MRGRLHTELGLKRLTPGFAKFEIVFGLAGVWASLFLLQRGSGSQDIAPLVASFLLFILGGYLAMAGSRSHLYRSNNVLATYLAEQVRSAKPADKG